ncbi:MAG: TlpA disulfide reductase family protein [Chitinophagaceae bacterium]
MQKIPLLLVLITLFHCSPATAGTINGDIPDFDPAKHAIYVTLSVTGPLGTSKDQVRVNDKGHFSFACSLPYDMEVTVSYNDKPIPLLVAYNDSTWVSFYAKNMDTYNYFPHLSTKGKYAKTNRLFWHSNYWLQTLLNENSNPFMVARQYTNHDYKQLRMKQWEKNRDQLLIYAKDSIDHDALTRQWLQTSIDYGAGSDLSLYPYIGKMDTTFCDTDPYFDFIHSLAVNNTAAVPFACYNTFLKHLSGAYEITSNIYKGYRHRGEVTLANGKTYSFPLYLERLLTLPDGVGKQIVLARFFKERLNVNDELWKAVARQYLDTLYRYAPDYAPMVTQEKPAALTTLTQMMNEFDGPAALKKELLQFFEGTKDKVVYIDFWFTNCPPCMRELGRYNALIDTLKQKKVDFIFFGVYMDEPEWKETIAKYQLKGKHFLLTRNQLSFFEKYFNVASYPHHTLIDKQGIVAYPSNAPRMYGDGNFTNVYEKLALLSQ